MRIFSCAVALLLTGEIFSITPAPVFRDEFSSDSLATTKNYVQFQDDCFAVVEGTLKARFKQKGSAYLNILPVMGRNALFSIQARAAGDADSHFNIVGDTRYNLLENLLYFHIDLRRQQVTLLASHTNSGKKIHQASYSFSRNTWHTFKVDRSGDEFTLSVDGKDLITAPRMPSPASEGEVVTLPEMATYAGFALYMDTMGNQLNPNRDRRLEKNFVQNAVDFDNIEISGEASPLAYRAVQKSFQMGKDAYNFAVIFPDGWEKWAKGAVDDGVAKMQDLYAKVYPLPADHKNLGMVLSRGPYYYAHKAHNNRTGIVFQFNEKDKPANVSRHELVHNWACLYANRWSKEGVTYVANVILREVFQKKTTYLRDVVKFKDYDETKKVRFAKSLLDKDTEFQYDKGAAFWYMLYRQLGYEGWLKLHRRIYERGKFLDTAQIKELVVEVSGRDLKSLFAGWTEAGAPGVDAAEIFRDSDGDGFSDFEEAMFETDPHSKTSYPGK
jgi:Laminin G domain